MDDDEFNQQLEAVAGMDEEYDPNAYESAPLPEESHITLGELVSKDDPVHLFGDAKKVGEGAAGEVFLATNLKTKGKVAIKKMKITDQNAKLMITEIGIMKSSKHPNIVEYIDSYLVESDRLWVCFASDYARPRNLRISVRWLWNSWEEGASPKCWSSLST